MVRYADNSRLDLERQEWADIGRDFREGWRLGKVCRYLRRTPEQVRRALFDGRLLGIQLEKSRFRPSKEGKEFKYPWKTCYRYPIWQFESQIRKYLLRILVAIRKRAYPPEHHPKINATNFYKTVRSHLFTENHHLDNQRPIDLLRKDKKSAEKVTEFFKQ
jgi:hypothetical protein